MRVLFSRLLLIPILLLTSCSLFGGQDEETGRISEDGVDGVRFGDSIEDILRKLGQPYAVGWIDGPWRSWYVFSYGSTSTGDTLKISFTIPSGQPDSLSVADMIGVYNSYGGTTAEGIGIGSRGQEVREAFGEPELVRGSVMAGWHYCMGKREVELIMHADTVHAFFIGFHEPLPDWFTQCYK